LELSGDGLLTRCSLGKYSIDKKLDTVTAYAVTFKDVIWQIERRDDKTLERRESVMPVRNPAE
jgi:hypothetical protein